VAITGSVYSVKFDGTKFEPVNNLVFIDEAEEISDRCESLAGWTSTTVIEGTFEPFMLPIEWAPETPTGYSKKRALQKFCRPWKGFL